ncbi:hypothetical protein T439DRAFT_359215 [Meredithblackwellia eburnea MCA 4105]
MPGPTISGVNSEDWKVELRSKDDHEQSGALEAILSHGHDKPAYFKLNLPLLVQEEVPWKVTMAAWLKWSVRTKKARIILSVNIWEPHHLIESVHLTSVVWDTVKNREQWTEQGGTRDDGTKFSFLSFQQEASVFWPESGGAGSLIVALTVRSKRDWHDIVHSKHLKPAIFNITLPSYGGQSPTTPMSDLKFTNIPEPAHETESLLSGGGLNSGRRGGYGGVTATSNSGDSGPAVAQNQEAVPNGSDLDLAFHHLHFALGHGIHSHHSRLKSLAGFSGEERSLYSSHKILNRGGEVSNPYYPRARQLANW